MLHRTRISYFQRALFIYGHVKRFIYITGLKHAFLECRSTNSSGAMGPLPPPSPHKLNGSATSALHRPTPDFSAMFDNSGGGGRNPFPHYTEPAVSSPAPQQTGVTRPAAVPLAYPSYNPVGFTGNVSGYASGEPLRYEQQQQPVNHTSAPYPSQGI